MPSFFSLTPSLVTNRRSPPALSVRATADLSRYWVEQVAANVLPSVVTLQISYGDQSNWVLASSSTPDGLILTNSHVVTAAGPGPQAPARSVVTLNDGRTASIRRRSPPIRRATSRL